MKDVRTWDASLGGFYGETWTDATTVKATTIPPGTKSILVNVTGDFRMQLAPPLAWCAKTTDNELTFTDYTSEATDKSTSTSVTLSSLSTAADGDYFYCASKYPFGGIYVDCDALNASGGGTLTGYTWEGAWVLCTIADGTNATQTFARDGVITWTPPASWKPDFLKNIFPHATAAVLAELPQESLYVIRFQTSAVLDDGVTLDEVVPVTCATAATFYPYGYFQADTDYTFNINRDESGGLAIYDSSGSKTVLITFCKYGLREIA